MKRPCTVVTSLTTFAVDTVVNGRQVDLAGIEFPGLDGKMHAVAMPVAALKEFQIDLRTIEDAIVAYNSAKRTKP